MFVTHGVPWMGKKAVEMGRYGASELMRNEKFWKKAIDYTLDKLNPTIQNVGSQALDQLPTKIRLNKKYKTDRKDLDCTGFSLTRKYASETRRLAEKEKKDANTKENRSSRTHMF